MAVTDVSVVTANGVSGTVANPTTTPAITLTLGAIAPSSVASTGAVTGTNIKSDGNNNTALGINTLLSLTTGNQNTCIGVDALDVVTDGANNVASGYQALYSATHASQNTAIGMHALKNVVSGNGNTAVGYQSLMANTAGVNTAIGQYALSDNQTGNANTAIGVDTLGQNFSGENNVGVGASAGNPNVDGSNNIYIGANTAATLTSGDYNIIIGSGADVPAATTSNYLNIGGVITGDMSTGDIALADGFNGTTQAAGDNSTKLATTEYVDATARGGSGPGGATETTGSADITLTDTSTVLQNIAMTAADKKVVLPDATTLPDGRQFILFNTGSYEFVVYKSSSAPTAAAILAPGQTAAFYCTNTGSALGTWIVGNFSAYWPTSLPLSGIALHTPTSFTSGNTLNAAVCQLTATTALTVYRISTGYAQTAVLTVSGNSVSNGTVATINAETSSNEKICALSSTKGICVYNTGTAVKSAVIDVSGTTATPGTVASVDSTSGPNLPHIAMLTSTTAICTFCRSSASTQRAVVLSVSGSTITVNTAVTTKTSSGATANAVCALSSTLALTAYCGASGYLDAQCLSISGTTITTNTALTNISGSAAVNSIAMAMISSTKALVVYAETTGGAVKAVILSVSGTTVTAGTVKTLSTNASGSANVDVTIINSTTAMVSYTVQSSAAGFDAQTLRLDTTNNKITQLQTEKQLDTTANDGGNILFMSGTSLMAVYSNYTTGYMQAAVIDAVTS